MAADPSLISESFAALGLSEPLTRTLSEVGYETPTPIQQQTIPLLLAGHDLIGQAQTGTGKTAAFALPILQRLDLRQADVQALVLTPTRELAIQVAEAIHTYARHMGGVHVMPIYGGDSIQKQINRLRGGMHIVVGTPGRVMDHLRRGTLGFQALRTVVLDEADEMLRMGFLEDVEWILSQAPEGRQTALFSATMPREVRRIADRYLRDPRTVEIKHKTVTVPTIEQHYINVPEKQKLNVLTHLLEAEAAPGGAILIFARTKVGAADLTERLQARGYAAEAMHGDMSQAQRESVIRRMRGGQVEIVVATDVAARGLDVEHIGHVINYDIPNDPESYVHRIGRTARAGRAGKATLLVTPREGRMLREIERYTGQRLTAAKMPTRADVAARRMALFKERLLKTLREEELEAYLSLVEELMEETGRDMAEIAAAAVRLARGDKPFVVPLEPEEAPDAESGMVRLFIDAGRRTGVRPSDIVGAIANEAGVPGKVIGAIDIYDDFTFVEVPAQFRDQVLAGMSNATIRSRETNIRLATSQDVAVPKPKRKLDGSAKRHKSSAQSRKKDSARKGKKAGRKVAKRS
ncbi:MAG TPA: DEAD/DEAH box helicase [Blastocatellia bacterium]|nr:DEAD/DEAH box helicase [Blastocatellia bacterium]